MLKLRPNYWANGPPYTRHDQTWSLRPKCESFISLVIRSEDEMWETDITWMLINRVGWKHALAMLIYSDRFRTYRKALQPYLGSESAVAQFNTLQEVEVRRFLLRVLWDQTKLAQHIQT